MKIIIGLGNAESRYNNTRHNVGFAILDEFMQKVRSEFMLKDKFKAHVAETSLSGDKILLVKPVTFYNESGISYRAITDFYKIDPADVLIVHDELSLPFGTVRMRLGGSDAGNNGIKSINAHGGATTARIRIGVSNERRTIIGDTDFVLGKFSKNESVTFNDQIMPKTITSLEAFSSGHFEQTSFSIQHDE